VALGDCDATAFAMVAQQCGASYGVASTNKHPAGRFVSGRQHGMLLPFVLLGQKYAVTKHSLT
jgi:hypothetical protein